MPGFDHSANAAQVAGQIEYLSGDLRFFYKGLGPFPALVEPVAMPPKLILEGSRTSGHYVALTIVAAVFGGKRPVEGESFRDSLGRSYRIHKPEGAPTDAAWRFICGSVTALPAT